MKTKQVLMIFAATATLFASSCKKADTPVDEYVSLDTPGKQMTFTNPVILGKCQNIFRKI